MCDFILSTPKGFTFQCHPRYSMKTPTTFRFGIQFQINFHTSHLKVAEQDTSRTICLIDTSVKDFIFKCFCSFNSRLHMFSFT